ncbi:MAG: hypothetical protein L3K13_05065 [Thermoplasmata archaeon]|nr:hypothetical protein [Thermoplasmata archaeon]
MKACPSCGSTLEYEHSPAELETATCATCERQFTLVTPGTGPATLVSESTEEPAAGPGLVGPECEECGEPMQVEFKGSSRVSLTCEECSRTVTLLPSEGPAAPAPRFERIERREGSRGPPRASVSRPCRQCGAPLRFSTDDDGNTVGECEACGNRFTLPPRENGGRGGGSFRKGGFRPRPDGGGGGYGRRAGTYDRRGPPRRSDRDSPREFEGARRRRKPRGD